MLIPEIKVRLAVIALKAGRTVNWVSNQKIGGNKLMARNTAYKIRSLMKDECLDAYIEYFKLGSCTPEVFKQHLGMIVEALSHKPANPVQKYAWECCIKLDHGWFGESKFFQQAYTVTRDDQRVGSSGSTLMMTDKYECFFCGFHS